MPALNLGQILGDASGGFMAGQDRGQTNRITKQKANDSHKLMAQQIKASQATTKFNNARAQIEQTKADEVIGFFAEQKQQSEARALMNNTITNISNIYTDKQDDKLNAERVVKAFNTTRLKSPRIQSYLPRLVKLDHTSMTDKNAINKFLSLQGIETEVIANLDDQFYQEFSQNGAFAGDVDPQTGELDEVFETQTLWASVDQFQSMTYDAKLQLSNTMKAIGGTLSDTAQRTFKPTPIMEREEMFNDMVEIEAVPEEQRTTKQRQDYVRYKAELTKAYDTTHQRNAESDIQQISEVLGGEQKPTTTTEQVKSTTGTYTPDTSPTTVEAKTRNTPSIYTKDVKEQEKNLKEARKSINDVQTLVDHIDKAATAGTYNTGPIDYWYDLGLEKVGALTDQQMKDQVVKAGIDTKTGQLIGKVVKQISGASATEDEYRRKMVEVFGAPTDSTEVRIAHMKAYLETLENDEADLTIELEKFLPVTTGTEWRRKPMSVNTPTAKPDNGRTSAQDEAASFLGVK